jgi:hypothetical protein
MSIHQREVHSEYVDGCFMCKVSNVQLNAGDARSGFIDNGWTNKKWDNELSLYRSARAQGIKPAGTTTAKIREAMDASDKTGVAYG